MTLIIGINVITRVHDDPGARFRALVEEGTSYVSVLLACGVPMLAALWLRRRRPLPLHAAGALLVGFAAFVLVHVGGFVALRKLVFAASGAREYRFPIGEVPYEALKDALGYGLAVSSCWRLLAPRPPSPEPPTRAAMFDIEDGARLVRSPVADILAVRSAGNYAEFHLADGRLPLMRAPLTGLEAALGPHGFVRTHRSWLVNVARVSGMRPSGSGDHLLDVGGISVPVSRRYRDALAAIRG